MTQIQDIRNLGVNLAEAFSDWLAKSEKPEQDLNMQEVSDAWDLLMLKAEQYKMLTAELRAKGTWGNEGCADCPDEVKDA